MSNTIKYPEVIKQIKNKDDTETGDVKEPIDPREKVRQLLLTLTQELVSYPQDIQVTFRCGEKTTIYNIHTSQRNIGQILGSNGRNIAGVRTLVSSITSRQGFRSIVEVPFYAFNKEEK